MKVASSSCVLIIMTTLSIYKGAMAPARACYCSPCLTVKVGGVSSERGAVCAALAAPLLCWESLLYLCLNGDNSYLQLVCGCCETGLVSTGKEHRHWIKGTDKRPVSLFEDPDQRTKGSLDLPLEVHLQEMSD